MVSLQVVTVKSRVNQKEFPSNDEPYDKPHQQQVEAAINSCDHLRFAWGSTG